MGTAQRKTRPNWPPPLAAPAVTTSSRTIELGDHVLVADTFGDPAAPPVVLLHGIPGWRGTWRRVGGALAPHSFVIVPDLAGFGESSQAPAAFHAAEQADLVVATIRQLSLGPVHLAGFDFGGPTAVLVYAKAPELVASLTLAATNVLIDTRIPAPLRVVRVPVIGSLFARLLFGRLGLTLMWCAAVARRERFTLADYRAVLRFSQGVASTRRVFEASLRDLPGLYGPVQATLERIRVPCTIVWGDRDPFFPIAVGERTVAHIPGATFVVLEGCGHFLPAEDPEALAQIIAGAVRATKHVA